MMGNLTDYFERTGYRSVYTIGDRVIGQWNSIPFVGTVGVDHLVSVEAGPEIIVHVDLPLKFQDQFYHFIRVQHKDLRKLPEITEEKKSTVRRTR